MTATGDSARATGHTGVGTTVVRRRSGWHPTDLAELGTYRDLLWLLAWRDLSVRYKQTAVGVAWAVLEPLAMVTVFAVFFGQLARFPSGGVPYPVFALTGLVAWQVFAKAMGSASTSLVRDQRLVSKIYFPRIILPIASMASALADGFFSALLLVVIMALYGVGIPLRAVFAPLFLGLMLVTALGMGVWLSAINVKYRDVNHLVPFLTQLWFFLTPVVYPASLVPPAFRTLYAFNPMVTVVNGLRWSVLGIGAIDPLAATVSVAVALVLALSGLWYFQLRERGFSDYLV